MALSPFIVILKTIGENAFHKNPPCLAWDGAIPWTLLKARLKAVGDSYPYFKEIVITFSFPFYRSTAAKDILRRRRYSERGISVI